MKKIYIASLTYMVAGLVSGLFYREFTKANDFTGGSQLSLVHTHLLALDKLFNLSGLRMFTVFFWVYNTGLVLTAAMMVLGGIFAVQGVTPSAAIAGISGLGHIGLTAGLVLLFITLGQRVSGKETAATELTRAA